MEARKTDVHDFIYHVVNGVFFHKPSRQVMPKQDVLGKVGEDGIRTIKREHTSLEPVQKLRKRGWRKVDLS